MHTKSLARNWRYCCVLYSCSAVIVQKLRDDLLRTIFRGNLLIRMVTTLLPNLKKTQDEFSSRTRSLSVALSGLRLPSRKSRDHSAARVATSLHRGTLTFDPIQAG